MNLLFNESEFFIFTYINNLKNKFLKLIVYLILSLFINIYKYLLIIKFLKYLKIKFQNINNLNFNILKIEINSYFFQRLLFVSFVISRINIKYCRNRNSAINLWKQ